jgi:hypothetical protein
MHYRNRRSILSTALCLLALAGAACGDDDKKDRDTDEAPADAGGVLGDGAVSGDAGARDGSLGLDGGDASARDGASDIDAAPNTFDGATTPNEAGAGPTGDATPGTNPNGSGDAAAAGDGATGGSSGDGATGGGDAAASGGEDASSGGGGSDAAAGGSSDAAAGGGGSDAASGGSDGSTGSGSDAAAGGNDAAAGGDGSTGGSSDAGAGDAAAGDAGTCDVRDPRFGCGDTRGNLVVFDSGFTVDTTRNLVWAPVQTPLADNNESPGCGTATFDGVNEWLLPTIDQVKTLVTPCDSDCPLATATCTGEQCVRECTRTCAANAGTHPSGGYCRPELADCSVLFTVDACDIGDFSDCSEHRHWYYDPSDGKFKLVQAGQSVAGRCVAQLAAPLP